MTGNLGQQLGQRLGMAEADKLGLTGQAREELVNTYQETVSRIGSAAGALAAGSATGQSGARAVSAAFQGADTATAVDEYNRQLHTTEAEFIRRHARDYAAKNKLSEEQAVSELTRQALLQVDSAWATRIKDNPAASAYLQEIARVSGNHDVGGGTLFDARNTSSYNDHTINANFLPKTADVYNTLNNSNVTGLTPNVRGAYVAMNDAANDPHLAKGTPNYKEALATTRELENQAHTSEEQLAAQAAKLGIVTIGSTQGNVKPDTPEGKEFRKALIEAQQNGLDNDGGNPIGGKASVGKGVKSKSNSAKPGDGTKIADKEVKSDQTFAKVES